MFCHRFLSHALFTAKIPLFSHSSVLMRRLKAETVSSIYAINKKLPPRGIIGVHGGISVTDPFDSDQKPSSVSPNILGGVTHIGDLAGKDLSVAESRVT